MGHLACTMVVLVGFQIAKPSPLRFWTDAKTGQNLEADLVEADDETAVLKTREGELVSMPIERLTKDAQAFIERWKVERGKGGAKPPAPSWQLHDGTKVQGNVTGFHSGDLELALKGDKVLVQGQDLDAVDPFKQLVIPKLVSSRENTSINDTGALKEWLARQPGQKRTYHVDGVEVESPDGEKTGVPFSLFSKEHQDFLKPGWEAWDQAHDAQAEKKVTPEELARQRQADLYLRARARLEDKDRMLNMAANKLRIEQAFGVSRWRVMMTPRPGVAGQPTVVIVPGRNSQEARETAMARYPGFEPGATARIRSVYER